MFVNPLTVIKHICLLFCGCWLATCLNSCKIDSPVFPDKPDVPTSVDTPKTSTSIDKALLTGWWAPTVTTKASIYFGTDNFFYQDTLTRNIAPTAGFWRTSSDTVSYSQSLNGAASANFVVSKLTADSLILKLAGVTTMYHKVSRPSIISTSIITIAGNGLPGYLGDGGPATTAQISGSAGLYINKTGDIYFSDFLNNRIRKISAADGKISTVAGNGEVNPITYPNNSPATSIGLLHPNFITGDDDGNVYFTEANRSRINKITTDGKLVCIGGCASVQGFGGDGGLATLATFFTPLGLAVDNAGNIYVADNRRVRKIAKTGIVTTIAGVGTATYSGDGGPAINASLTTYDLAIDDQQNLYIADAENYRIRKITAATGVISTICGTGKLGRGNDGIPATNSSIGYSLGLKVGKNGDVYFTDASNAIVRKISSATGNISTVAGSGFSGYSGDGIHATGYSLNHINALNIDTEGNIYVSEENRIRKISAK